MVMVDLGFAVGNVLMKNALEEGLDSLVLITYRMVVSSIFLAPVGYFSERSIRPKLTFRILGCLVLSATLVFVLLQYCFLYGMGRTSATFACAFFNMVPVMTFLMAWPLGLETVNLKQSTGKDKVTGAILCTAGAMTLMLYKGKPLFNHMPLLSASLPKSMTKTTKLGWMISSLVLMLGSLSYSGWFILQSYIGKMYPCKYSGTAFMSLFGAIQCAIIASISSSGRDQHSMWVLKGRIEIITVIYTASASFLRTKDT
ncbi:hypothetical protein MLD38_010412 [Melastoma candidum]|uniref:Uncharacterized protein n=1 Tax=Melastoma candidum TaxID=119954 RepID=A0ACB9R398_9MYRT|nr:hypothetical protein MLD38_010412 [Melastoma candidum]